MCRRNGNVEWRSFLQEWFDSRVGSATSYHIVLQCAWYFAVSKAIDFSFLSQFDHPRYQLMLNCWSEFADRRPTFPDLVREFDHMITMLSDKVNIIFRRRRTSGFFVIPTAFEEVSQRFSSSCQAVTLVRLLPRQPFIQHTHISYSKSRNVLSCGIS